MPTVGYRATDFAKIEAEPTCPQAGQRSSVMATGLPLASMIGYLQRRARPLWTSCRRLRAKTVNSHERPEYSDDPSVRSAGTRSHLRQHRRDDGQHELGRASSIV